jgi:hypothetical protein
MFATQLIWTIWRTLQGGTSRSSEFHTDRQGLFLPAIHEDHGLHAGGLEGRSMTAFVVTAARAATGV